MTDETSKHSIIQATKGRAKFSGHDHGKALGAAGFISPYDEDQAGSFLSKAGQTAIANPTKEGMANFEIGAAWDEVKIKSKPTRKSGFFDKILGKAKQVKSAASKGAGIDLDIGCLYEMKDGSRGVIQAFGDQYGALDQAPYIQLSGDERTGEAEGEDELITVNGKRWDEFVRIIIYIYIYDGADNWEEVQPQVQVRVPEEKPMIVSLHAKREELALCAVARLENVRGGIRMTNLLEYFPGHAEMDRAFGFGLEWDEGQK